MFMLGAEQNASDFLHEQINKWILFQGSEFLPGGHELQTCTGSGVVPKAP